MGNILTTEVDKKLYTEATDNNISYSKPYRVKSEYISRHLRESNATIDMQNEDNNLTYRKKKLLQIEKTAPTLFLEVSTYFIKNNKLNILIFLI